MPPGRTSAMEFIRLLGIFLALLLPHASTYRNRIIGGRECEEEEHPWLVLLYHITNPYCSGILINEKWVLTAAHCCRNSETIVIGLGEHDLEHPSWHEQMRTSVETILYNTTSDCENECVDDIMLIKLNEPASITDYVAPVDMATSSAPLGTTCTVLGWGTTTSPEETYPTVPHCANITVVDPGLCKAEFPCIECENILCAGVLAGGTDSCRGDSGGPLICNDKLQGIVSLGGFPCAQPNQPAVYTKISHYISWIQQKIAKSDS